MKPARTDLSTREVAERCRTTPEHVRRLAYGPKCKALRYENSRRLWIAQRDVAAFVRECGR